MLVQLVQNKDYLRRIDRVLSNASDGLTKEELDRASSEAEDQVMVAMASIGFSISGWTSLSNTPGTVIEIIRLLGSAKVWHRVLLEYGNETAFDETYGATLYAQANELLANVEEARTLISPTNNRVLITPDSSSRGKGVPKMSFPGNPEGITDASLSDFVRKHGPDHATRCQYKKNGFN